MAQKESPRVCFRQLSQPDVNLLALHKARPASYPFFLESAEGSADISRFDLLFQASDEYLSLDDKRGIEGNFGGIATDKGFLENLNAWQKSVPKPDTECPLPFLGGWFLFLGYELVAEIEPRVHLPASKSDLPTALAVRCPAAIIHDRNNACYWAVAETQALLDSLCTDIEQFGTATREVEPTISVNNLLESDPDEYRNAVRHIKDYIIDGDVFQVNLSRRWEGELAPESSDLQLYKQLRSSNPAPFAGFMKWQDTAVISSSPERLVETRGDDIQTRPIAGTRPRSRLDKEDDAERHNLVTHPKERAEHIMLIDLERNDLGRICLPGSVEVNELMALESYQHVHHIVSNVRGRLRPGTAAGEVIRAVFPGGTITGCPKVRCMEIIAELEGEGRGYYTGAMGYLDRRGDMDLNILIRCIERSMDRLSFRTGAGIVADSVPENELQETRAKALGLLRALNCNQADT